MLWGWQMFLSVMLGLTYFPLFLFGVVSRLVARKERTTSAVEFEVLRSQSNGNLPGEESANVDLMLLLFFLCGNVLDFLNPFVSNWCYIMSNGTLPNSANWHYITSNEPLLISANWRYLTSKWNFFLLYISRNISHFMFSIYSFSLI